MKTIIKITAVCLLFVSMTSCMFDGIKGNRNVVSQTRSISSDFDAIKVSNSLEVYLTIGNSTSLEIEADENLHDVIITEVEDGVLKIFSERNIRSAKSRKIFVTAERIKEIKATSAAEIRSENTIETEDLKIKATSAANLRLMVNVDNLTCSSTSAAEVRLEGKAEKMILKSTSAAEVRAKELKTKVCKVSATSAANAYVNVSEELDAKATSAASVRYTGNPKKINKKSTSAGSISG